MRSPRALPLSQPLIPVNIETSHLTFARFAGNPEEIERKRYHVADTTKIEDKLERKKLKRAARKKAAPKAKAPERAANTRRK